METTVAADIASKYVFLTRFGWFAPLLKPRIGWEPIPMPIQMEIRIMLILLTIPMALKATSPPTVVWFP